MRSTDVQWHSVEEQRHSRAVIGYEAHSNGIAVRGADSRSQGMDM